MDRSLLLLASRVAELEVASRKLVTVNADGISMQNSGFLKYMSKKREEYYINEWNS